VGGCEIAKRQSVLLATSTQGFGGNSKRNDFIAMRAIVLLDVDGLKALKLDFFDEISSKKSRMTCLVWPSVDTMNPPTYSRLVPSASSFVLRVK
jgi:hypothetical protein